MNHSQHTFTCVLAGSLLFIAGFACFIRIIVSDFTLPFFISAVAFVPLSVTLYRLLGIEPSDSPRGAAMAR